MFILSIHAQKYKQGVPSDTLMSAKHNPSICMNTFKIKKDFDNDQII